MPIGLPELIFMLVVLILLLGSRKVIQFMHELEKSAYAFQSELQKTQTVVTSDETENPLKIFISSVMNELAEERKAVARAIREMPPTRPWLFEQSPPSTDTAEGTYIEQVNKCDIFMLIIGCTISDPVKKEYEAALQAQKPVLIFIKSGEKDLRTTDFIKALDIKWGEFSGIEELSSLIQVTLATELIKGYRRYRLSAKQVNTLIAFLGISHTKSEMGISDGDRDELILGRWEGFGKKQSMSLILHKSGVASLFSELFIPHNRIVRQAESSFLPCVESHKVVYTEL